MKPLSITLIAAALLAAGCAGPLRTQNGAGLAQGVPGMDAEPLYRLGRYLHGQQKFDDALRVYDQVLAADPGHVNALNAIGAIRSLRGEDALAEQAFRRAIAEGPAVALTHNNLGYHLLRTGRASEALTELAHARALAPRDEAVQVNIALARQRLADVTSAAAAPSGGPQPPRVAADAPALGSPAETVALQAVAEGVWELRNAPGAPSSTAPGIAAGKAAAIGAVRFEISNGNGSEGLARRVREALETHARLTNQKPFGRAASTIQYSPGYEQAARQIAARMPMAMPVTAVAKLQGSQVRVLLGKDFPGEPAALAAIRRGPQASLSLSEPQP